MLNYIGPEDGEGIRIYIDGQPAGSSSSYDPLEPMAPSGDGRVIVGRYYTDDDSFYATVDVDELLFFNEALTDDQVTKIKNTT